MRRKRLYYQFCAKCSKMTCFGQNTFCRFFLFFAFLGKFYIVVRRPMLKLFKANGTQGCLHLPRRAPRNRPVACTELDGPLKRATSRNAGLSAITSAPEVAHSRIAQNKSCRGVTAYAVVPKQSGQGEEILPAGAADRRAAKVSRLTPWDPSRCGQHDWLTTTCPLR